MVLNILELPQTENPVLTASEVKVNGVAQKAIQTKGDTLTGKAVNVVGSTVRLHEH